MSEAQRAPESGAGGARFQGQVCMVTGASRGIGRGIAMAFAREGALVGINFASSEASAAEVADAIASEGGEAVLLRGDVRDSARVEEMVEELSARRDRLDVLVNCAGIIRDGLVMSMEPDDWASVIETNLTGTFNCARAVARRMMSARQGRIVNVSSISSSFGRKGQGNYAASKGGVEAFTRVLALELAAKNVTVNAVCPGLIETEMVEAVKAMTGEPLHKRVPLRRLGQPEDVARAILFLASQDASYITGQCLTVDGGLSLGLGF
jgi:3-oxoacyl-[acyl-carrier protein] reductase